MDSALCTTKQAWTGFSDLCFEEGKQGMQSCTSEAKTVMCETKFDWEPANFKSSHVIGTALRPSGRFKKLRVCCFLSVLRPRHFDAFWVLSMSPLQCQSDFAQLPWVRNLEVDRRISRSWSRQHLRFTLLQRSSWQCCASEFLPVRPVHHGVKRWNKDKKGPSEIFRDLQSP